MLKPQDCVILIKLLANKEARCWSQSTLATHLCISVSEVNASLKRLQNALLIRREVDELAYLPIKAAVEEFLIHGLKYVFSDSLGEYTRGFPTGVGAEVLKNKFAESNEPVPVWPSAKGTVRGLALKPLYSSVTKSIQAYPDQNFYDTLALVDAVRQGRAKERNIAIKLLKERIGKV